MGNYLPSFSFPPTCIHTLICQFILTTIYKVEAVVAMADVEVEVEDRNPAITALGPLFNLTEIYLWDDGLAGAREEGLDVSYDYAETGLSHDLTTTEDRDFAEQMKAMGLPHAFHTNKEWKNSTVRQKRNGMKTKYLHTCNKTEDKMLYSEVSEPEIPSSYVNNVILEYDEFPLSGKWVNKSLCIKAENLLSNSTANAVDCPSDVDEFPSSGERVKESFCFEGEKICSGASKLSAGSGEIDFDFGEWRVYWDSYYSRNYFYNVKTEESTWDPPSGMEHLADVAIECKYDAAEVAPESNNKSQPELLHESYIIAVNNNEITSSSISETPNSLTNTPTETVSYQILNTEGHMNSSVDNWDTKFVTVSRRKKHARRTRSHRTPSLDSEAVQLEGILEEYGGNIEKYWWQRYLLFWKFEEGIKMDEEGWFSVTPEAIAKHHASRCSSGMVIDCFTGVGGNSIQFAKMGKHVIAIDIDPKKIEYAQHNAAIYGVDDRIEFIKGDSFLLAVKLKADTVFLSPPWGGPDYAKVKIFDIYTMLKPQDGRFLFNVAKGMASKIILFLPRNVDFNQLAELALTSNPPWSLEVEKNYLNGKLKAVTAYFTDQSVN